MWRIVFCVTSLLVAFYMLMSAYMQAWLTAADPAAVAQHRLWACVFLGLALFAYVVFGVLLRPRSVLHFCLCTVAVPVAWCALMTLRVHCGVWPAVALVVSGGYLLWRSYVLVNRLTD